MNTDAAARQLYDNHCTLVYRMALTRGVPERDALDVTQQVFERALLTYDRTRPFLPYLVRITRNEVYNFHKRHREEPSLLPLELRDTRATADVRATLKEQWCVLLGILAKLEPEHRVVFELAVIEGFSQEEIAGLLGLPATTVESRLRGARQQVNAAMDRLRAGGNLPAIMLLVEALRRIQFPQAAQARVWSWIRRGMALRRAADVAQGCAVVLVAGLFAMALPATDSPDRYSWMDAVAAPIVGTDDAAAIASPAPQPPPSFQLPTAPRVDTSPVDRSRSLAHPPVTARRSRDVVRANDAPKPNANPARGELILMQGVRRARLAGNRELAIKELLRHKAQYPNGHFARHRDRLLERLRRERSQ